ncbi:type VII secretion protein EssA [Virgibacillus halodenitrificans]|nr:type VII secretion protein EssA [Virgibacillus halodenitrificans]
MKKKLLSLLLLVSIMFVSLPVHAEDNQAPVEPNIYEKKEINIKPNSREQIEQREELPEEQKQLSFEKKDKTESNLIKEKLFASSVKETNTITSKSNQLGLFSQKEKQMKLDGDEENVESSTNVMMLLIIAVVLIIGIMFFVLLPKLKHSES